MRPRRTLIPPAVRRADRLAGGGGFTLLEMLVATAVFIMVLVILSGVIGSVTSLSSQASARLDAVRLGREIFDLMQKDLIQTAGTLPSRGTNVPLEFWVNPPAAQVPDSYKLPTAVFWQSAISRDRSVGNLAVVGYFVQRYGTNQSQLRRVLIEPNNTNNYQIYTTPGSWLGSTTLSQYAGSVGSAASTNADLGWVANGVLGLWVRCLDANGNIITTNGTNAAMGWAFDSLQGYRSGSGTNALARVGVNALPAFVDVGLVCVATRDLDRIVSMPAVPTGSPATFDSDIASYLTTFQASNPRVKTAVSLTRRYRIAAGN